MCFDRSNNKEGAVNPPKNQMAGFHILEKLQRAQMQVAGISGSLNEIRLKTARLSFANQRTGLVSVSGKKWCNRTLFSVLERADLRNHKYID